MNKKFIVLFPPLQNELEYRMMEFVQELNCGYWHWMRNVWLLAGNFPVNATALWLYERMIAFDAKFDASQVVVTAIDGPATYFGRFDPDSWDWMRQNWGTPG